MLDVFQAVANIANGYSKLDTADTALFGFLSEAARNLVESNPSSLLPQTVATILNSFAKVDLLDSTLFLAMAARAKAFSPRSLYAQVK